jgi:glycosyltransferase involved in cell wall biosynthesis
MNFGLVGWGVASGNGGMNSDLIKTASWITHWLIPEHPTSPNHDPYLKKLFNKTLIPCGFIGDTDKYNQFLDAVDGVIYIEHPCLKDGYDIIGEAKKRGKVTVGIPMWEWWPERKPWALNTDILWAVTKFTSKYLNSLSDVLFAHGWNHSWRSHVAGSSWGVNLDDFPYVKRHKAERFIFINGNGGYKLRKASDLVFKAFAMPGAPLLTVYTQQMDILDKNIPENVTLINKNFSERKDVYQDGDVYLFPSYWEGLCHGLYEAQASGGLVITTDHPPMDECGSDYLVPVEKFLQEDLSGKKIVKALPDVALLHRLCSGLHGSDIEAASERGRSNIESNFNLNNSVSDMYEYICNFRDK